MPDARPLELSLELSSGKTVTVCRLKWKALKVITSSIESSASQVAAILRASEDLRGEGKEDVDFEKLLPLLASVVEQVDAVAIAFARSAVVEQDAVDWSDPYLEDLLAILAAVWQVNDFETLFALGKKAVEPLRPVLASLTEGKGTSDAQSAPEGNAAPAGG